MFGNLAAISTYTLCYIPSLICLSFMKQSEIIFSIYCLTSFPGHYVYIVGLLPRQGHDPSDQWQELAPDDGRDNE